MQDEINLVWDYLLPGIHPESLPANKEATTAMKEKISSLAIEPPPAVDDQEWIANISGKSYDIDPNSGPVRSIAFDVTGNTLTTDLQTDTATIQLAFGNGEWVVGETGKPGPGIIGGSDENVRMLQPFKVAGSFTREEGSLELVLKYIQGPHTEKLRCDFRQDSIIVHCGRGSNTWFKEPVLKGILKGAG